MTAVAVYQSMVGPLHLRARRHIHDVLDGYEILDPGLVRADRWHAPGTRGPAPLPVLAGVGKL